MDTWRKLNLIRHQLHMDKKEAKHIIDDHYGKIKKELDHVIPGFDAETIHQFRVAYKKGRAVFRMLSYKQEQRLKTGKKLKETYRTAGEIRDLQLQRQRVIAAAKAEFEKPKAYLFYIKQEIDKLMPALAELIKSNPVVDSKKKSTSGIPSKFYKADFKAFVQNKWVAINTIITTGNFTDEHVHTIRKYLKDLFYNLNIFHGVEQDILSMSIWNKKDEQYVYLLLTELGNFQDMCMSIILLRSYLLENISENDRETALQLKDSWTREKRNLKRSLVRKLKTLSGF